MMENLFKALRAIAEGHKITYITHDRYIQIENPDYLPDNGEYPYLVIDVEDIEEKWKAIQ